MNVSGKYLSLNGKEEMQFTFVFLQNSFVLCSIAKVRNLFLACFKHDEEKKKVTYDSQL